MRVSLEAVGKQFGDLTAVEDLDLTIEDGEFVTLVGPSGCGKTTTLRMIAGLESPTSGRIFFGDRDVTDLSPQQRDIAFVFQAYALYPHMTARRNMAFALEGDLSQSEIDARVEETAEMLGISEQLDQQPGELSGGQKQRVALGRSIVRDPDVFLLDEPLSNLDAKLRVQMRAELQTLHQELETTMIYVTHDQEEAMTMSDRIAIMNDGRLQQVAPPNESYNQPANRFVAGFIGSPAMNFLDARLDGDAVDAGILRFPSPADIEGEVGQLGVRPEDLSIAYDPSEGHAAATVRVFEQLGSTNVVYLRIGNRDDDIVAEIDAAQQVEPGEEVGLVLDEERVHLFDTRGDAVYNPPLYTREEGAPAQASDEAA
ncbi:MAG: ABC transporter ATP-binding protein [Halobacteriales archaeon]